VNLPETPLKDFSWTVYMLSAAAYTIVAFNREFRKKSRRIFSKRNARSFPEIGMIHLTFLILLYGIDRITPYIYPSLPGWMTDTFYFHASRSSAFQLSYFLLMGAMILIERPWLYVEYETSDHRYSGGR
jgi:hypothetical protein